ncbi:hypothetical protein Taro_028037 [Colocasia esculenta]|uniref:Uncharacterized protein n=1 Tax=Colocasia esculenta TaxID=4460 RepID=A0A843VG51_COLES|nr:hypothetical protein [Colocasia esculenta]
MIEYGSFFTPGQSGESSSQQATTARGMQRGFQDLINSLFGYGYTQYVQLDYGPPAQSHEPEDKGRIKESLVRSLCSCVTAGWNPQGGSPRPNPFFFFLLPPSPSGHCISPPAVLFRINLVSERSSTSSTKPSPGQPSAPFPIRAESPVLRSRRTGPLCTPPVVRASPDASTATPPSSRVSAKAVLPRALDPPFVLVLLRGGSPRPNPFFFFLPPPSPSGHCISPPAVLFRINNCSSAPHIPPPRSPRHTSNGSRAVLLGSRSQAQLREGLGAWAWSQLQWLQVVPRAGNSRHGHERGWKPVSLPLIGMLGHFCRFLAFSSSSGVGQLEGSKPYGGGRQIREDSLRRQFDELLTREEIY